MKNFIFAEYLSKHSHDLEAFLQEAYGSASHPDIDRYLYAPLREYSANSGKRHRPLICMLACKAVGGTFDAARSAAAAIEYFHTAALIHDDIADESKLRRGKPCLYITEGAGLAINAGDLALSLVTGTVLNDAVLSDTTKLRVLQELVNMTTRTIEGQALDLGWVRDGRFDINIEDYLVMAQHKTAFYSGACPLAIGALIGGGSDRQIEVLRAYGMQTGLAFQIQDDILNLVGGAKVQAKDYRSDITEGKRTMIVVHALAKLPEPERQQLHDILVSKTNDPAKLAYAVELMTRAGSIDYARNYAGKLVEKHIGELEQVLPETRYSKLLLSMGDFFIHRDN